MDPEPEDLRYSDGPSTAAEIHVDARPEAVFGVVSDINLPARWSTEFKGAQWLDEGPATGARFVGKNAHPRAGEWETTCTVIEYDPPRSFVYQVEGFGGEISSTWAFRVEPDGDGSTLTQSLRMGPGRSFINVAIDAMPEKESKILHRRLGEHRKNMEANLAGIKEMLEP